MRSIALINQKGGQAKTTCTINIGSGLARLGKKVLVIDFDPQSNLTLAMAPRYNGKSIFDLLQLAAENKPIDLSGYIVTVPLTESLGVHLLPASMSLAALETLDAQAGHEHYLFKKVMDAIKENNFDYVLVDCPPTLGKLTINVLAAVEEVYLPMQPEFFALQGLSQISQVLSVVNQEINPRLHLGGIIGTRYIRRKLHKETISYLKKNFSQTLFNTVIRESIALAEAPSFSKDIYSYSPESTGAEDYMNLCKEIIQRELV